MTTPAVTAPAEEPRPSDAQPPSLTSWFQGPMEPVPLSISGQHTITVRREISAKDRLQIMQPLTAATEATAEQRWQQYQLRKVAAYLQSWTLPRDLVPPPPSKPTEKPLDPISGRAEVLRTLRASVFDRILAVVAEHEESVLREQGAVPHDERGRPQAADAAMPGPLEIPIIPPVVTVGEDAWFAGDEETHTLQLPGGHWIRVRAELSQGETLSLLEPPPKDSPLPDWRGIRKLALYIRAWSMVYPIIPGQPAVPAPVGMDSLAELEASKFSVLNRTIQAYEEALSQARAAHPSGATGSNRPPASLNGSTAPSA